MKKNNQKLQKRLFILNALAASVLLISHSAHALQALDDSSMRNVNAQDGLHVNLGFKELNVDTAFWSDNAGRGSAGKAGDTTLRAEAENFKIQAHTSTPTVNPNIDIQMNTGSQSGKAGMDFQLKVAPLLISMNKFKICDATICSSPVGDIAVQTNSDTSINFTTRDGLFSKDSQGELSFSSRNASIFLGQTTGLSPSQTLNQLILKNFNFNFLGKGVMYVDGAEGFIIKTNSGSVPDAVINYNPDGSVNTATSTTPSTTYGYVDLTRVDDPATTGTITGNTYSASTASNSGLNLEFMINKNVNTSNRYSVDATKTPRNGQATPELAKGLIRLGASGRMVNGLIQIRGTDTNSNDGFTRTDPVYNVVANQYGNPDNTNIVGKANNAVTAAGTQNIIGDTGIAFRMKTDFTKKNDPMLGGDNSKATVLEIGGSGFNTYGFEFGELTGLNLRNRGSFDTGNVYLNLVDTKTVLLPANKALQTSRYWNGSASTTLTTDADYIQSIHNGTTDQNPFALLAAIRGGEFQSFSRSGRFTNSARTTGTTLPKINDTAGNTWGLALPFYDLNANLALYGTTAPADAYYYDLSGSRYTVVPGSERLGFSLAMSTTGMNGNTDTTKQKTTSILLLDSADTNSVRYVGLRNIDMLLKGTGTVGLENGSFNASLKDLLIILSAQVAGGYLPGAVYKGTSTAASASSADFSNNNDVLLSTKLRLDGKRIDLSLIPNSEYNATNGDGSRLSIVGELELKAVKDGGKSAIQFSDPLDGSTVGFDNIDGKMAFNNAIVIAPDTRQACPVVGCDGMVTFKTGLTLNPAGTSGVGTDQEKIDGVLRVRDINFYPPAVGAQPQRLGEMALTGGRITGQFGIIPRN
ncbi:MAG: heme utilization protein [Acinetobacter sp.]